MNIVRRCILASRGVSIVGPTIRLIKHRNRRENTVAAFGTSTIVLAVKNTDLREQLNEKDLTTTTISPFPTTPAPIDMSKYRLPRNVIPDSYDLYLYPNLQSGLFNGKVTVIAHIQETTKSIILNTNKLDITKVIVNDNEQIQFNIDADYERAIITRIDGRNFDVGDVTIMLEYKGDLRTGIVGLYRSSYNNNGTQRYIATSKFEPTYARQAYPCFDEPNLKAKYTVHLLKPNDKNYIALSNYPQSSEETVNDGILVHFDTTVPMSTYLSCFIVSDFIHSETNFDNNGTKIPFRVYASPGQLEKTTYAGYVGKTAIEYYIKYFNIPYPLPKLDLVAIPDFVSGAMEHWGLVTFRETALLYTNKTHSSANQQRVATVVAHELAHSWFGNLVTMNWWDNLWLNEGFATYIEYKGVNAAEPDWNMLDQFVVNELHSILKLDATQGSHPIIQTVTTPDQITEVFDSISYNKGASVLRMLEDAVGEENFRRGVTNYLNAHRYGNAITQDLWNELQNVITTNNDKNQLNITEFMNTFTIQMGYPILMVEIVDDKYVLKQKRFLTDPDAAANGDNSSPLGYKWTVPVTYITDLNSTKSEMFWFHHEMDSLTIEKPDNVKWLKFNPNQIGYYRTNYPAQQWYELIDVIDQLKVADRAHLIEESFNIAESGDLNYQIPLNLTKYLVKEFDYVPWSAASTELGKILNYLENTKYQTELKKYIAGILKPAYVKLGWNTSPDDKHLDKLARVTVLTLACKVKYPDALNHTKQIFNAFITNSQPVDQNLRSIVYEYGMIDADEATWLKLFDLFVAETDANEKLKLMKGLANVEDPSLLNKLIELAKDDTYVRSQDYFTLLQSIAANPIGRPIVWDYVREHWLELVQRFTLNDRYLGALIPAITKRFSTSVKLDEMKTFFAKYPEAGAGVANRRRAIENVQNNIKWLTKYRSAVEDWIVANTQ